MSPRPTCSVLVALLLVLGGCPAPPGPGADDLSDPGADLPGIGDLPGAPDAAPVRSPIADLDPLALVINLGDSVAAGYNAAGRNGPGGHGYARLLVNNHADFPKYSTHDLFTLFPGAALRDLSRSGATSDDMVATVRGALPGLPASVPGDVLVLINVGGNDLNDRVENLVDPAKAAAAAAKIRRNLAESITLLRGRYENPAAGKAVIVLIDNIHDPTDNTGAIPVIYRSGFCNAIHLLGALKMQALANLATVNREIAAEATTQRAHLVDIHDGFIGHGMNGGADRWLDTDCVHPINLGHDLIRRLAWAVLTGQSY